MGLKPQCGVKAGGHHDFAKPLEETGVPGQSSALSSGPKSLWVRHLRHFNGDDERVLTAPGRHRVLGDLGSGALRGREKKRLIPSVVTSHWIEPCLKKLQDAKVKRDVEDAGRVPNFFFTRLDNSQQLVTSPVD